ncbi:MAG: hypothetical protein EOO03_01375 [Chitinophagaceae bacterium]|nr:MAG: hypothetical protein EOO03_01375 [Chitinophagaceae bacterium]
MEQYLFRLFLFSSTLLAAAVAGGIKVRSMDSRYRWIVVYLIAGVVNEVIGFFCGWWFRTNVVNNNFFMLAELLILNFQFMAWNQDDRKKQWYLLPVIFFSGLFLVTSLLQGVKQPLVYFNFLYCFYLALCATTWLARLMATDDRPFYKNARAIICSCMMIYFSYRIIVEAFWLYGLNISAAFRIEVQAIIRWINLFINFLYLYALKWIPKKPDYITYYG